MSWALVCKVFQRRSFDLLTYRGGVSLILFFLILLTFGLFYFGQVLIVWSISKTNANGGIFLDNIGGRSYQYHLCHIYPIDVVYTWVNGSDPILVKQLNDMRREMHNYSLASAHDCTLSDCIPANGLTIEHDVTDEELIDLYTFSKKPKCFQVFATTLIQTSCVLFDSNKELHAALSLNLSIHDTRIKSVRQLYYTSDGSNVKSHFKEGLILALGLPEDSDSKSISSRFGEFISHFHVDITTEIASFYADNKSTRANILKEKNFTVSNKIVKFLQGFIVWDLEAESGGEMEMTANRFRDMEELMYSLRSLEKFAPWVRHVFIVTNGQIPSWLDLSSSRITVITHEDIFENTSHLPTFSSPAIETHLHRIPGLSEHFIYLNDDIFFGQEVWPDNFISEDGTQNIYLTYPVPDCKVGCPGSWIRDGYCDKVCNCSECDWDGGDCDPNSTNIRNQYNPTYNQGLFPWSNNIHSVYCNQGCADNWIADRYCDVSCNVYKCGFDAGDCGPDNFDKMQEVPLKKNQSEYFYFGYSVLHFNLYDFVGSNGYLVDGEFDDGSIVRSFSYVNSSRLMTLVLKSNHSKSSVRGSLNFTDDHSINFVFNFTIFVDTSIEEKPINNSKRLISEIVTIKPTPPSIVFPSPRPKRPEPLPDFTFNLRNYHLPSSIHDELKEALKKYDQNLLTNKGLMAEEIKILKEYFKSNNIEWLNSSITKFFLKSVISKSQNVGTKMNYEQNISPTSSIKTYSSKAIEKDEVNSVARIGDRDLKQFGESMRSGDDIGGALKRQYGSLPWEKKGTFDRKDENTGYEVERRRGRRLMDAFADSIRHVNRLYNRAYGYFSRKVPAHSAHFFNRKILSDMNSKFYDEFQLTSSNKVRSSLDMQLSFSYYYYLMSEKETRSLEQIFDDFDIDRSGVLSDRELRVFLTRVHKLPLFLTELQVFESNLMNCSAEYRSPTNVGRPEVYHERRLPQVTLDFISNCSVVKDLLVMTFSERDRYKYKVISESDGFVSFQMIRNNATTVLRQLDEIRKNMKKFVCLNDDVDDSVDPNGAEDVRSIIRDFYVTFFPKPSQFELEDGMSNPFRTVVEYRETKLRTKNVLRLAVALIFVLMLVMFYAVNRFRCKRFVLQVFRI